MVAVLFFFFIFYCFFFLQKFLLTNNAEPDQNAGAASELGLHCLHLSTNRNSD